MFEINKKKKVYLRLPDVWGKKDTPFVSGSAFIPCPLS